MDREEEARREVHLATENIENAYAYVLPRILFFEWVFAVLDGIDSAAVGRRMREALLEPGANMEWTIEPMLDYLRPRLGESNFNFFMALAKALSYSDAAASLDEFPQWSGQAVTSGATP
jgi:hypothetical protein